MRKISRKLKWGRILSVLIILLEIALMIYMIEVEDEPGALPLFFIIIGTIWLIVNQNQIKKQIG